MSKQCCEQVVNHAVYWNPYNNCVQCHSCGHVWISKKHKCGNHHIAVDYFNDTKQVQCLSCGNEWRPANKFEYLLNRLFKWW